MCTSYYGSTLRVFDVLNNTVSPGSMLTIASDREFDERNEQIRTSPTPLPGASNLP